MNRQDRQVRAAVDELTHRHERIESDRLERLAPSYFCPLDGRSLTGDPMGRRGWHCDKCHHWYGEYELYPESLDY